MGKIFSIDVSDDEDDSCCGSDNTAIEEHEPNEALVGRPVGILCLQFYLILIMMTICPPIPSTFVMFLLQLHCLSFP